MGKKNKKTKEQKPVKQMGQAAQLLLLVKRSFMAIGATALFTITLMIIMLINTNARIDQQDISSALNLYRTESRKLTSEIQSYAVTGQIHYLMNYNKEMESGKREQAIEFLHTKNITAAEWETLNQIMNKSAQLE